MIPYSMDYMRRQLRVFFPRHYTAAQMMQEIKVALKERQQRLARQRNRDAR